jgi:polar amino acid transport system substrate-binding protein
MQFTGDIWMSILTKYYKLFGFCALFLTLPIFASQAASNDKKPLVLCGTTWGKLSGNDLPNKGFVPDLVMRVFRHAGYEVSYKIMPWPRCLAGVKNRTYDVLASAWHGKKIDEDFNYMNDILIDSINFIVLEGSPNQVGKVEDFYGQRVGIVRDAGGIEEIFAGHDKVKIQRVASLGKLPRMLIGNRFAAIVSDPVSLNEVIKVQGLGAKHKFVALEPPLQKNIQAPLISKTHPDKNRIIADFNMSFKKIVNKAFYDDLIKLHDLQVQYPDPAAASN